MNTTSKHEVRVDVKANDAASKNFSSIAGSAMKLGAAFLGVRQIVGFLSSAFQDFKEGALAVSKLRIALRNIGKESDLPSLQQFASDIQKITIIGDDTSIELMKLGVSLGLTGDTLRAATIAAIGFHTSLDWDLQTSMQNVAKAANGNFRSFKQLGIVTADTKNETEAFAQVMAKGLDGFKMQQDGIDQTVKSIEQMKNAWGDMKESLVQFIATANDSVVTKTLGDLAMLMGPKKGFKEFGEYALREFGPEMIKSMIPGLGIGRFLLPESFGKKRTADLRKELDTIQGKSDINAADIISKATPQTNKESMFGDMASDGFRRGGGSGESRFLTMRAGSPIDRTAENTRKMAEMQGLSLRTLNLIYDVLSKGGSVRDMEVGRGYTKYGAATSFS